MTTQPACSIRRQAPMRAIPVSKVFSRRVLHLLATVLQARPKGRRRWRHGPRSDADGRSGAAPRSPPLVAGRVGLRRRVDEQRRPSCWSGRTTARPGSTPPSRRRSNAASPGDWILVAPGRLPRGRRRPCDLRHPASTGDHGGVVVTTSDLHIRGMNRDTRHRRRHQAGRVGPCSSLAAVPELRPRRRTARPRAATASSCGRPNDVSIENLTVCNFQGGAGDSGNEVWWNGGDGSGKVGLDRLHGQLPHGDDDLLRHRERRRPSTASSRPTRRARPAGTRSTAPT